MTGMTACEHCGAEYPSPFAAALCCEDTRGYD